MQIGGTLITALVRVLVVVGTLAAVSYFVIRPVLDTTEKVSSGINSSIQQSIDEANDAFDQTNVSPQTQRVMTRKIRNVPNSRIPKLENCITRAGTNISRINHCIDRYAG
ncbi:MAG: hypothetical protein KDB66_12675 [Solirubrobacterales bacterium]|nr:hypothetical protein [Solirubrobacterales bacterium]MCB8915440.1 hypothetical protein [Thermoleophilales bacterium]